MGGSHPFCVLKRRETSEWNGWICWFVGLFVCFFVSVGAFNQTILFHSRLKIRNSNHHHVLSIGKCPLSRIKISKWSCNLVSLLPGFQAELLDSAKEMKVVITYKEQNEEEKITEVIVRVSVALKRTVGDSY